MPSGRTPENRNGATALPEEEADRLIAEGDEVEASGNLNQACELFRKAVAVAPGYAKAQLNLGVGLEASGDKEGATLCYEAALTIDPANAYASYNLGKLMYTGGALERAEALLQSALKYRAQFPEAQVVLASVYEAQGRLDAAVSALEDALAQRPEWPGALFNYGVLLKRLGRQTEAEATLSRVVASDPENADACYELAMLLQARGAQDEAEGLLRLALERNSKLLEAHVALGSLRKGRSDFPGAENHFRQVVALKPDHAASHYLLGDTLFNSGDRLNALAAFDKALSLHPDFLEAHWARTMAQIPSIYRDEGEIASTRSAFARDISELETWIRDKGITAGEQVGMIPPFFLAYTEENNRNLLARHGDLCARLMGGWLRHLTLPDAPALDRDRIKVGIVSAHVFDHSVWNAIIKGWLQNLNRERFSVTIFHLGSKSDDETVLARSYAAHFEGGEKSLDEWVRSIALQRPDVLIYAEIGMDPTTLRLASLRLAPVQAATWGHPETTGLPTIDYYLSADLLEPQSADGNYTESLVRLPNLGVFYQRLPIAPAHIDLPALGIDDTRPILINPGTPFKYSPRYDPVFVEIARRLGDCQLVFFTGSRTDQTALLRDRLRTAFTSSGLDYDQYVKFIPWLERPEFQGLMKRAHVFLDSLGFSGFNTAIQAVESGLPIVTCEGRFMRGRLASAILYRMGLPDLVARTETEYIDLAVKLVADDDFRESFRVRMARAQEMLYNDVEPVKALEKFLEKVAGKKTTT